MNNLIAVVLIAIIVLILALVVAIGLITWRAIVWMNAKITKEKDFYQGLYEAQRREPEQEAEERQELDEIHDAYAHIRESENNLFHPTPERMKQEQRHG